MATVDQKGEMMVMDIQISNRNGHPLAESYFHTWSSGSKRYVASPDPPDLSEARPFVVQANSGCLIPMSVLVFARDEQHAVSRVLAALKECCDKDYRGQEGVDKGKWLSRGRQYELLAKIEKGEYTMFVQPLDTALMPSIEWASNGGL